MLLLKSTVWVFKMSRLVTWYKSQAAIAQAALFILFFEVVSSLVGIATRPEINGWYSTLQKPALTPPNAAFPIVWTILYALTAYAAWRLSRVPASVEKTVAVKIFAVYMILNWCWSFVWFSLQQLFVGFLWIILLNIVNTILIAKLLKLDRRAAFALLPLICWTGFATYLAGSIWWLNSSVSP